MRASRTDKECAATFSNSLGSGSYLNGGNRSPSRKVTNSIVQVRVWLISGSLQYSQMRMAVEFVISKAYTMPFPGRIQGFQMPRLKVPVSLRVLPEVHAVGMARAADETRSFASYIESLIIRDARQHGLDPLLEPRTRTGKPGVQMAVR